VWDDPYVRRRTREQTAAKQKAFNRYPKYGIDLLCETNVHHLPDVTIVHPEFVAERYDRKDGSFPKAMARRAKASHMTAPKVDLVVPRVRKQLEAYWVEFFEYFHGFPHVETVEQRGKVWVRSKTKVGGDLYYYDGPFYSPGALEDYRRFAGDPKARFPVAPGDRDTDRTFCTTDRAAWDQYKAWLIDAYTEGVVCVLANAARKAFGSNPDYKGLSYMDGGFVAHYHPRYLLDIKKIAEHPGVCLLINEHGWLQESVQECTREWDSFVRKGGKRMIMLVNLVKLYGGPGPGEIVTTWGGGQPRYSSWKSGEALWKTRKIFALFPQLDGLAWHSNWTEDLIRFWMAYQTVEWDRGVMPRSEAEKILAGVTADCEESSPDFNYDETHIFEKVKVKRGADFAAAPKHVIEAPRDVFRGRLNGREDFQASFRILVTDNDTIRVSVEVTDDCCMASPGKQAAAIGKGWAWKDKVDIYLGFAEGPGIYVLGKGVIARKSPPDKKRYTHRIGEYGNTIWVEAQYGEEQIACYYKTKQNPRDLSFGRAEWTHSGQEKRWTGRIQINLKAMNANLAADKLTGFNLGIQDVDETAKHGDRKDHLYVLYETYPRGVHDTARYADIEIVE